MLGELPTAVAVKQEFSRRLIKISNDKAPLSLQKLNDSEAWTFTLKVKSRGNFPQISFAGNNNMT